MRALTPIIFARFQAVKLNAAKTFGNSEQNRKIRNIRQGVNFFVVQRNFQRASFLNLIRHDAKTFGTGAEPIGVARRERFSRKFAGDLLAEIFLNRHEFAGANAVFDFDAAAVEAGKFPLGGSEMVAVAVVVVNWRPPEIQRRQRGNKFDAVKFHASQIVGAARKHVRKTFALHAQINIALHDAQIFSGGQSFGRRVKIFQSARIRPRRNLAGRF